jgi:hypothetical protein
MKKFKSISVVATIVVLGIVAIVGGYIYTTTDAYQAKKLYNELGNDYTASQCDSLTKRFPNSEYAELAQEKKRSLLRQQAEWNSISSNPSVQGLKTFKKKHELTAKYSNAADEKIDSLLWIEALNSKLEQAYEEYAALGQMARNYNETMNVLQWMHKLPEVASVSEQLKEQSKKFFEILGNGDAKAVAGLCSDTISLFLYHQNYTPAKVVDFVNNVYCKNIKQRTFVITSDIELSKARIAADKAGYAALFNVDLTAPSKIARKHKATILFTLEGKIASIALHHL